MRKESLVLTVLGLYSVVAVTLALSYKDQLLTQKQLNTKLQTQIATLRDSSAQWEQKYKLLNDDLINTQKQLTAVQSQMKDGSWFYGEGIATAYSPLDNRNGIEAEADGKKTSTGKYPGPNIIAVDPTKIPYGSQMMVVYEDGTVCKGIAGDTGGALRMSRGLHIDMYRDTFEQAKQHGTKAVLIFWKPEKTTK